MQKETASLSNPVTLQMPGASISPVSIESWLREKKEQMKSDVLRLPTAKKLNQSFSLTPKECEFALLLLRGLSTKEVSAKLEMTAKTGRWYCNEIMQKCGVNRQSQLIIKLLELSAAD